MDGSSRWNVFGKKVIPFEVFPFSRFDRNSRKFLYHLSTTTSARENGLFHLFLSVCKQTARKEFSCENLFVRLEIRRSRF